ncbi:MAG: hypothetical protein M3413_01895 [Bacteroidota bacterium]|nr:hypothetical protein [Bacteroidota bacterium]
MVQQAAQAIFIHNPNDNNCGIVFTFTYIYPINEILMTQAGGSNSANEIQKMVDQWIFADRMRFAVMFIGYIFY